MERTKTDEEGLIETRERIAIEDDAFFRMVSTFDAWNAIVPEHRRRNLPAMRKAYAGVELDLDTDRFSSLISSLKQNGPLDAYETTRWLEACSKVLAAVGMADSGLLRPQRGREQIEVELRGFEEDYVGLLLDPKDPEQPKLADLRQIIRTICLLRTILKPFVKELTGKNWRSEIEPYLGSLSDKLFSQLDPSTMRPEVQQVVRLFWKYDIGGRLLWDNEYSEQEHQAMKNQCPLEFVDDLDDVILISYLCSGGSHTSRRWFTNREAPEDSPERKHPAVLPIDQRIQPETGDPGTLDRFFMRSTPSGPLKLEVASRRRAAKYLQCTPRVGELLRYYTQYAQADGTWSATMEIVRPDVDVEDIKQIINEQAMLTNLPINALLEVNKETGEVMSVSLVPDPSGTRGTPDAQMYEGVVRNLLQEGEPPFRRNAHNLVDQGDAYACIGVIPGYDHNRQPSQNAISNAMAILKELRPDVNWDITYRDLYAVWVNDGKLIPNHEPVLVVSASHYEEALDPSQLVSVFSEVAAALGQSRYFGGNKELQVLGVRALTFAQGS